MSYLVASLSPSLTGTVFLVGHEIRKFEKCWVKQLYLLYNQEMQQIAL